MKKLKIVALLSISSLILVSCKSSPSTSNATNEPIVEVTISPTDKPIAAPTTSPIITSPEESPTLELERSPEVTVAPNKNSTKETKDKIITYSDNVVSCKYNELLLEPELQVPNEIISYALFINLADSLTKDSFPSKTYLIACTIYNTEEITLEDFIADPESMVYNFAVNANGIDENSILDYKINDLLGSTGTIECIFTLSDYSVCKFKFLLINNNELTYVTYKLLSSDDSKYKDAINNCYESFLLKKIETQKDESNNNNSKNKIIDDMSFEIRSIINNSTPNTDVSITDITINDNLGTDEKNDYIVLAYLSFDVKNRAKTAKEMLNILNNEIGYNMAKINNVSELTIFWQVPYLKESGNNIAKANLKRNDKGFYFEEEWYDSSIFE